MNRSQRIVVVLYCLLVVYCCVWVPWHYVVAQANDGPTYQIRTSYGWLWSGPTDFDPAATPNLPVISLRLLAVTALAGAAFLTAYRA